ncbi:MAG TPA: type I phosphomannose isomerase catalytic subunit [Ktedonobacterales bacterium]
MHQTRPDVGPLRLEATLHETIWGGRHLETLAGKRLPADARIGESWETETGNRILNGAFAGQTLARAVDALGEALLGTRALEVFGARFPLLAKFIDAQDQLSVQVHPNDTYAREHGGGKLGKTEAWYVLRTEPGARLVYGLARTATETEVRAAIAANRLEDLLHAVVVHPGDVVYVPAGTVHAIGAGVALYELQEYSDITYRLYDYGRLQANGQPRELHVDAGLAVMRYEPSRPDTVTPAAVTDAPPGMGRRVLVACPYFVLVEMTLDGLAHMATSPTSCEIVTVLAGECQIAPPTQDAVTLRLGESAVLPARLGDYELRGANVRCLRSYVPEERDALLLRWQAAQPGGAAR